MRFLKPVKICYLAFSEQKLHSLQNYKKKNYDSLLFFLFLSYLFNVERKWLPEKYSSLVKITQQGGCKTSHPIFHPALLTALVEPQMKSLASGLIIHLLFFQLIGSNLKFTYWNQLLLFMALNVINSCA